MYQFRVNSGAILSSLILILTLAACGSTPVQDQKRTAVWDTDQRTAEAGPNPLTKYLRRQDTTQGKTYPLAEDINNYGRRGPGSSVGSINPGRANDGFYNGQTNMPDNPYAQPYPGRRQHSIPDSGYFADRFTQPGYNRQRAQDDTQGGYLPYGQPAGRQSVKVGLLVPLSGQYDHIGQAMLKASELAAFKVGARNVTILPRDTKGTAEGARQAVRSALDEGAELILGPFTSGSTKAVAPLAREADVNVISFTTDWSAAGDGVFTMGFLPFSQVTHIVRHAAENNMRRVGVLAPDTAYARTVMQTFQREADRFGVNVVKKAFFPPSDENIAPILRQFTEYDPRVEALNQKIRPLKAKIQTIENNPELQERINAIQSGESEGTLPFDAVFLPVGGETAKSVANLLSFYDMESDKVIRLGTGLWDDRALATETNLDGARFAAPSPRTRTVFEQDYTRYYGAAPPRLASLAYDATALAIVLANIGQSSGRGLTYNTEDITNPNGFEGVDGIFRFRPDGLIDRALAILIYEDKQIKILERAPTTFQMNRY